MFIEKGYKFEMKWLEMSSKRWSLCQCVLSRLSATDISRMCLPNLPPHCCLTEDPVEVSRTARRKLTSTLDNRCKLWLVIHWLYSFILHFINEILWRFIDLCLFAFPSLRYLSTHLFMMSGIDIHHWCSTYRKLGLFYFVYIY